MNGLAKSANWIILEGLKIRLDLAKGGWVEELTCVLLSYRVTIHIDTKETLFKLTFGHDAIILVEIRQPSNHISNYSEETNDWLRVES